MVFLNINDPETEFFLQQVAQMENVPLVEKVREAIREYKARHYDGVYFSKQEVEIDLRKTKHELKRMEETKPELELKLKKLESILSSKENDLKEKSE